MKHLLFALALAAGMGCTGVQPIGPMAKRGPAPTGGPAEKDLDPPGPVVVEAPRPTPPAEMILPSQVAAENPQIAVQKLTAELQADERELERMPKTSSVSVIKR